jgi:hypothetical protein
MCTPRKAAAALRPCWPWPANAWARMGSSGPRMGRSGVDRVGPSGSARTEGIGFLFSEIILNAKTILENLEIVLKA